jgi:hypothetical protein
VIAIVPRPSSVIKMIFARHTCFCGELPAETIAFSRTRSAAETSNVTPVRMQDRRIFMQELESQIGLFCLDQTTRALIESGRKTSRAASDAS